MSFFLRYNKKDIKYSIIFWSKKFKFVDFVENKVKVNALKTDFNAIKIPLLARECVFFVEDLFVSITFIFINYSTNAVTIGT